MHRTQLHIRRIFAVAMALLLMATVPVACSDDGPDAVPTETGIHNVGFRITLNEISGTRATPTDGTYDDGRSTPYENYINIIGGDYKVMLFETTPPYKLAAVVSDIQITAVEADVPTSKTYVLTGKVSNTMTDGSYKLMLLTNWAGCGSAYPTVKAGVTTIDDITAADGNVFQYQYSPEAFKPGRFRGIPMYGIKDCPDVVFRDNVVTDLGRIHLLRAMSKIEVCPRADGLPITNAVMTRTNTTGLAAPKGIYRQEDYVKDSYKNDYLDNVHLPEGVTVAEDLQFMEQTDGSWIIYVPEYDNTSSGVEKSKILLTFGDETSPVELDFKYYDKSAALIAGKEVNDPFDIKRNYFYKYIVYRDREIIVTVDVIPYGSKPLDPIFGL